MRVALVSLRDRMALAELTAGLAAAGVVWTVIVSVDPDMIFTDRRPDALVLDMFGALARPATVRAITAAAHEEERVPVLGLVPRADLNRLEPSLGLDDFALHPVDIEEVGARLAMLAGRETRTPEQNGQVVLGDLRIDPTRYEVWVGSRQVALTFKEYELLRLLSSEPGRVFTREVLLDRVWGYDYFGGTRTVDVHIRRVRSKLEDPTHTFIETVRNVGYRLRVEPSSER